MPKCPKCKKGDMIPTLTGRIWQVYLCKSCGAMRRSRIVLEGMKLRKEILKP